MRGAGGLRWAALVASLGVLAASCGTPTETVDASGSGSVTSLTGTLPPASTTTSTTLVAPPLLPQDELIQLQLDCVYGGQAPACDKLVVSGYPSAGNYGLGNSLTESADAALVDKCNGGWRLMCAELLDRYPDTNGVPPTLAPVPTVPQLGDAERMALQVDCVYSRVEDACGRLAAAGYSFESNYGLGRTYVDASDDKLGPDCQVNDLVACAEIRRRYPPAPGDDVVAANFVTALIAGAPLDGVAPSYLAAFMAGTPSSVASIPETGLVYDPATGLVAFVLSAPTKWLCYVGAAQVRTCATI
jgi:hypothetical protein